MTKEGLGPQYKKIQAIVEMVPPQNKRELRWFIGLVNFCKNMCRERSYLMALLTAMTCKGTKFE